MGATEKTPIKNNIKTIFYIIKMDLLDVLGIITVLYFVVAPCYLFYIFISYFVAYLKLLF